VSAIPEWTWEEVQQALAATPPPLLVDVRTEGEFAQGSLPGAVNIPLDQLDDRLAELPPDRVVVCLCPDGERAAAAAAILGLLGRTAVVLRGGLTPLGIVADQEVDAPTGHPNPGGEGNGSDEGTPPSRRGGEG
jgi:rhodanese-related sulfurtransferase